MRYLQNNFKIGYEVGAPIIDSELKEKLKVQIKADMETNCKPQFRKVQNRLELNIKFLGSIQNNRKISRKKISLLPTKTGFDMTTYLRKKRPTTPFQ